MDSSHTPLLSLPSFLLKHIFPLLGDPHESQRNQASAAPRPPPPAGPSKTFTIDIPMTKSDDVVGSLEALRLDHEGFVDRLVEVSSGDEDDEYFYEYDYQEPADPQGSCQHAPPPADSAYSHASSSVSLPVGASALSTPPSSTVYVPPSDESGAGASAPTRHGRSSRQTVASLGVQPQFNLDSAQNLLDTFRTSMLSYLPCTLIPEDATVTSMATERPFVLLAVLAAASSSRTLQGHSLYDDEFRKILGLKFVAGGERSIELLQGLVIYVAWYVDFIFSLFISGPAPAFRNAFTKLWLLCDFAVEMLLSYVPYIRRRSCCSLWTNIM